MSKESEYWSSQEKHMEKLERSCRELKKSWHKAVQEIKAIRVREGYITPTTHQDGQQGALERKADVGVS